MPPPCPVIDVWMQQPTERMRASPVFATMEKWFSTSFDATPPETTAAVFAEAGVNIGLASAWWSPEGSFITNDEVKQFCDLNPTRFKGLAAKATIEKEGVDAAKVGFGSGEEQDWG